jgi:hypothetical protein
MNTTKSEEITDIAEIRDRGNNEYCEKRRKNGYFGDYGDRNAAGIV